MDEKLEVYKRLLRSETTEAISQLFPMAVLALTLVTCNLYVPAVAGRDTTDESKELHVFYTFSHFLSIWLR